MDAVFGDVLCYFVWGVLSFCLTSCDVRRQPTQPAHRSHSLLAVSMQVSERGGARKEQEKQNGGLFEEEAAPKQHRKPERTLRYTDTHTSRELHASSEDRPTIAGLVNYSGHCFLF